MTFIAAKMHCQICIIHHKGRFNIHDVVPVGSLVAFIILK